MQMKKVIIAAVLLLCVGTVSAQQTLLNLSLETRVDYQRDEIDGKQVPDNSGFKGRYLNIMLNGDIGSGFTYAYRQRLNKQNASESFFDATDWLYLTYATPNDRWEFSAGKQAVAIGGYEYDISPIDCYFYSEYCNNIACFQFGASAMYKLKGGNDSLLAQVTESPFRTEKEMFAYNLMWLGRHGVFQSLYSLNALEWMPGKYVYYIALGNRFNFGSVECEIDLMNRATEDHAFFLRDYSVMGFVKIALGSHVNLLAKVTHDVNKTTAVGDLCVVPGTELTRVGSVVEYYPIKGKRNVRLHAGYNYTFGKADERNTLRDKQTMIDVGLTWRLRFTPFS